MHQCLARDNLLKVVILQAMEMGSVVSWEFERSLEKLGWSGMISEIFGDLMSLIEYPSTYIECHE